MTSKMLEDFDKFEKWLCKASDIFYIKQIDKTTSYEFVKKYHYLGEAKFFCKIAFGLFYKGTDELVGCATYQLPQGNVALKGWFGLGNDTKNIFELGRLCMLPRLNGTNATSFLLGGSIKELKKLNGNGNWFCRGIITLACAERHIGSIYQVCNFKYYGLSDAKNDFFTEDGKINPRGATSNVFGVWLPRPRKHRYAYILDDTLTVRYDEQKRPSSQIIDTPCCHGTNEVYDKRFDRWYTCPKCTGKLTRIYKEKEEMSDQTLVFIENHLEKFNRLHDLKVEKERLDNIEKTVKQELETAMNEYGITQIKTDLITISKVEESTTTTVDLDKFKKNEPEEYDALLEDYPKTTTRKAYLRFSVK